MMTYHGEIALFRLMSWIESSAYMKPMKYAPASPRNTRPRG
jgi:hypothetical protein